MNIFIFTSKLEAFTHSFIEQILFEHLRHCSSTRDAAETKQSLCLHGVCILMEEIDHKQITIYNVRGYYEEK